MRRSTQHEREARTIHALQHRRWKSIAPNIAQSRVSIPKCLSVPSVFAALSACAHPRNVHASNNYICILPTYMDNKTSACGCWLYLAAYRHRIRLNTPRWSRKQDSPLASMIEETSVAANMQQHMVNNSIGPSYPISRTTSDTLSSACAMARKWFPWSGNMFNMSWIVSRCCTRNEEILATCSDNASLLH